MTTSPRAVSVVPAAALLGAVGAAVAFRGASSWPRRWRSRWVRINHSGDEVTLLEGPAYAVGAAGGAALAGPAPVVAVLGAAAFGLLDDLAGDSSSKGLKGHLRALTRGELTTGAVKIVGLVGTGVLSAAVARRARGTQEPPARFVILDEVVHAGLIAGSANLGNLFDLRPGRALKVSGLAALPLILAPRRPGSVPAAAAAGAALGVLTPDLRGQAMLGDTGANAAGALLGSAWGARLSPRGRWVALALVTGLTLASERVSFSAVIDSTPGLRELDAWGRTRPGARP